MQDIFKSYQSGGVVQPVLKGINLKIYSGELVAIMGASGSGKTTLINMIGILDRPTSGKYLIDEKDVTTLTDDEQATMRNKVIGFVFQSFFLLPRLSLLENVGLPLYYRHTPVNEKNELALKFLEKVGLKDFSDRRPGQLSGGQQQRVAVARALVGSPTFILADEPTGALDSKTGQLIMNLFKELNSKDNITIIIVTHDPKIAEQCMRTIRIQDGMILSE